MRFGISTHLFHATPLERDHLRPIGDDRFERRERLPVAEDQDFSAGVRAFAQ